MWFTAMIIGFAGSFHCVAMCSPLAMAVTRLRGPAMISRFLYHGGRVLTYGIFGAIVSSIGTMFAIAGLQNALSVMLGIVLVIVGVAGVSTIQLPWLTKRIGKFSTVIKTFFSRSINRKTYASTFFLGAINGLLPCGLTFLALTNCLLLKTPLEGFWYMLIFGAGTLPAMFGLTFLIMKLVQKFQFNARRVTTVLLIVSGVLLVARVFMGHLENHAEVTKNPDMVICR